MSSEFCPNCGSADFARSGVGSYATCFECAALFGEMGETVAWSLLLPERDQVDPERAYYIDVMVGGERVVAWQDHRGRKPCQTTSR